MWGVIVGNQDRILLDTHIAFESAENVCGQVRGIPVRKGFAQSLTHLVNSRLGHQGHGHLSVTDVEVERTGPMPTQGLIEFEKLFDMPALWIVNSQILDFVTVGGGQEGFEIIILWSFTVTLNETQIRFWAAALFEAKRLLGGGTASPPAIEALRAQSLVLEFGRVLRAASARAVQRGSLDGHDRGARSCNVRCQPRPRGLDPEQG